MARAIGESYDGHTDPTITPNNWARAVEAATAARNASRQWMRENGYTIFRYTEADREFDKWVERNAL